MNTSLNIKDTLPRKDFTAITQLGLKALGLAAAYAAELGPRLPQGMVLALSDDVTVLGDVVPSAKQARHEARTATATQNDALAEGYAYVKQIRAGVRKAKASAAVMRAYGVGQSDNRRVVRDMKAAIQQILDRAAANPAEAAELGIVQKDLDALKVAHSAITDADATQEQKRAGAPLSTKERNRTANRILAAVGRIEGAGRMEFADDEAKLASFVALGAGPKREKKAMAAPKAPKAPEPQQPHSG